jgi:hypothetical protein
MGRMSEERRAATNAADRATSSNANLERITRCSGETRRLRVSRRWRS